jgi:site-specific DNA recombinase
MRAVIYARYSTDNQREASIEDQVRICRARAEREGWSVVDVYADYAISGAAAGRPRFQQLLTDARGAQFDVVISEALDRISRDQEHIAGFYKQLCFANVRVVTLAEGDISELHIGLKGTMSALFLKDLALKTHRGLEGRVRAGHSGGGLSFGYHVLRQIGTDGMPTTGGMVIEPSEAAIIQRIFEAYTGGQSPRAIGKQLNAEAVAGPRGGKWTSSLILGNAIRETGLLRNRLYVGERVWNRQHFLKDPMTGRRVARPNPREAWIINPVPDLRIIDPITWEAAQARLAVGRAQVMMARDMTDPNADSGSKQNPDGSNIGGRLVTARRPAWLLSGLVRCGLCGGPMGVTTSGGRLGCANRHERGTCTNKRTVLRDRLLPRVFEGLKQRLLAPELVAEFVRTFVAEVTAANRERGQRHARVAQDRAKVDRQMRNLLELIKDGHGSPAMVHELRTLEQRRDTLDREMTAADLPEPTPTPHPNLPELYRRKVAALETALQDPAAASAAAEALRTLIDAILVYPGEQRGEVSVELRGDLAAFLYLAEPAPDGAAGGTPNSRTAVAQVGNGRSAGSMGSLVAGIGFEPMTFRL